MVSLRRRKLLGLYSGKSSIHTPLPKNSENGTASENSPQHVKPYSVHSTPSDEITVIKEGLGSSNVSDCSTSKEQPSQEVAGSLVQRRPPIKRRKRHRRKHMHNQEPCLMRGVYFKNMKWQAAIKVEKKQIHLGTVGSQEEAAHLYDRAAFMCGREPNVELPEEEKQELGKFKWDEFLAVTRHSITSKKHKRRFGGGSLKMSEEPPLGNGDWDSKQGSSYNFLASEDAEQR
ncbi:Ethylene-responsive transcription factor-like protein [Quillaja saponaria]|uniref:Ethylene-responsive transcription factor-like protein n=1 Tax=Quillaja saponaria TaxID=32244 RepID=A0AAD7L2M2_QUISA|nr:Ethylene-responsive transcription factor-like protein [Quillaja saponaria]